MFDIGFLELIVIGVLALLVLGPERLPTAARTTGVWIGRIKQSFSAIQQEVNQQLNMEDLQRQLEENRRKLEDTLQQQEQSILEPKPDDAFTASNLSENTSTVNTEADHVSIKTAGSEMTSTDVGTTSGTIK